VLSFHTNSSTCNPRQFCSFHITGSEYKDPFTNTLRCKELTAEYLRSAKVPSLPFWIAGAPLMLVTYPTVFIILPKGQGQPSLNVHCRLIYRCSSLSFQNAILATTVLLLANLKSNPFTRFTPSGHGQLRTLDVQSLTLL
jgi:hypothetical protein